MPVRTLPLVNDLFGTNFPFDDFGTPELAGEIVRNMEIIVLRNGADADIAKRVLKSFALHETPEVRALVMDIAYNVQIGRPDSAWRDALSALLAPIVRRGSRLMSFDSWIERQS